MCGRYTLTDPDPATIRARFGLEESAELDEEPRYNIAPTDPVLAIRRDDAGGRVPGRLRWGLVPGRWAERRSGPPLINARAETLQRQPAFAESFRERRCLIPADGFYEWRDDERGRRRSGSAVPMEICSPSPESGPHYRRATARATSTAARSSPASRTSSFARFTTGCR